MKKVLIFTLIAMVLIGSATAASLFVRGEPTPADLNNAAYAAYHDGNLELAETLYLGALELDASYQLARYNLATLYFKEKRYDDALMHLDLLVDAAPENAQYRFDRAVNFVERFRESEMASVADFDFAIGEYLLVEELSPGFPHAAENAAVLERVKGKFFS